MKTKNKTKWLICLSGLLVLSASATEIVGHGDTRSASASHLLPDPPEGSCCGGEGQWVASGDPTYSWDGDVTGNGETVEWDTSLADPQLKQTKTASVTVTQNWVCSDSRDPSTPSTTANDSFSLEVWPKCGSTPYDSDDYCCAGGNLISRDPPSDPEISGPSSGQQNYTNQTLEAPQPRWSIPLIVGTTPVNPDCGIETIIWEREFVEPTQARIVNILNHNRWVETGDRGHGGGCGVMLDLQVGTSQERTINFGVALKKGPLSFSVSFPWTIIPGSSVHCYAEATENKWHYYKVFRHEVKLTGGSSELTYDVTDTQQRLQTCGTDFSEWISTGATSSNQISISSADIDTGWESSGMENCFSESVDCCEPKGGA